MSEFDHDMDFQTMYAKDYVKKEKPLSPRRNVIDHNDMITGMSRDSLKPRDAKEKGLDLFCPLKKEYYKEAVKRIKEAEPRVAKMYMTKDLDPVPIEHDIQDEKRTEYFCEYCSRDLPFMSVNLIRRARALQTVHLPDDVHIPATTHRGSYTVPHPDKYKNLLGRKGLSPKDVNPALQAELRKILRVKTGETMYMGSHGLLGQVVLENNPFGPPRKEPRYGRWRTPYYYTYYMNI